jgi:hypothetical protein
MKSVLTMAILLAAVFLATLPAQAEGKPIQLALFSPIQVFSPDQSITGLRVSLLYGKNVDMTGLDWGLVTETSGKFEGVQLGFVGVVDGNATGIQYNLVSLTGGSFTGLQLGWYNSAGHTSGLQFGLINTTGTIKGLQIGILNFIRQGGFLPFFPIVNGSF